MSAEFWITIAAILLGPISAVAATEIVARRRLATDRKLHVFRTLMQTRRNRVSFEHVGALNLVEVEFNKDKRVISKYKDLMLYLVQDLPRRSDESDESYFKRRDDHHSDLLTNLLVEMSVNLNYKHSQMEILRGGYSPIAHGDLESDQYKARKLISEIYDRRRGLQVIVYHPPSADDEHEQEEEAAK